MLKDDLEALRWFRDRLKALGAQYPGLKTSESQERLAAELERQAHGGEEKDDGLQKDRAPSRQTTQG